MMNTDMTITVKEAIQKNLSSEVGAILQQELRALQGFRENEPALKKQADDKQNRINELEALTTQLTSQVSKVSAREVEVGNAERKIFEAQLREKVANEKVTFVADIHRTIFANNTVRTDALRNHSIAVPGSGNCSGYVTQVSDTRGETQTG